MKNVVATKTVVAVLGILDDEDIVQSLGSSRDDVVYCVTSNCVVSKLCEFSAQAGVGRVDWRVPLRPAGTGIIAGFGYVIELDALCFAFSSGELVLLHVDTLEVEEVGTIQGGVLALALSPDGEHLCLISESGNLLVMSKDWEPLAELPICKDGQVRQLQQAALTWRGDGKFFATAVVPADPDIAMAPADADGACEIAVWDREGWQRHASAEASAGPTPCLAWQPNGRHLYAAHHAAGRSFVQLYERNGLQHGDLDVHHTGRISCMSWSADSELLALVLGPGASPGATTEEHSAVQVWHRSNWHWHLKHETRLEAAAGKLLVHWDEQDAACLHIVASRGGYQRIHFGWACHVSTCGTAAVIDGCDIRLTPLRHVVIPPPMCAAAVRCPAPVLAVALHDSGEREQMAALLAGGRLALAACVEDDLWEETLEDQQADHPTAPGDHIIPTVPDLPIPLAAGRVVRALAWADSERLLVLAAPFPEPGAEDGRGDVLTEVRVVWGPDGSAVVEDDPQNGPVYTGGAVVTMAHSPGSGVLVQLEGGALLTYTSPTRLSPAPPSACFPSSCPTMLATPPGAGPGAPPALGLTPSGQLFWGPSLVASEVTSVAVRAGGAGGPALLYTTRKSLMYTVPFATLAGYQQKDAIEGGPRRDFYRHEGGLLAAMHAAMRPSGPGTELRDVMVRSVEAGAALVAAPQDGVRVVMQMPRGNLEAVCPRSLVLCAVVAALQVGDYRGAWELATTHRVDLNLVVDYLWPSFLAAAPSFVAAVQDQSDICDLMFALKEEDVTAEGGTYHGIPMPAPPEPPPAVDPATLAGGKVNAVCHAVRAALLASMPATACLKAVVTSFARSSPPQLEDALRCIRDAKEEALAGGSVSADAADAALRHLLLTVNPDEVYREALGMYELPLAYMVVVNAQKDPGEFLAELQRFGSIADPHLRRHAIDQHLRRYEAALRNLVAAGKQHFGAALALAAGKKLERLLLQLVEGDAELRPAALEAHAAALRSQDRHEDAAVALLAAGRTDAALNAYRAAGQWRMVFSLAGRLQYDADALAALAEGVAEELRGSAQFSAAAEVLLHYLQDVDNAVLLLTTARSWREAVRVSYQHERGDLVETVVAAAAAESASTLMSDAADAQQRQVKYLGRLREVRAKRAALAEHLAAAAADGDEAPAGWDDTVSEAPSMVSGFSAYTDHTHTGMSVASSSRPASTVGGRKPSRNERRDRKQTKIRQGSPAEEGHLGQLVRELGPPAGTLEDVGQLTELLVMLGHLDDARTLQQRITQWHEAHQEALHDLEANPPPALRHPLPAGIRVAAHATKEAVRWKWDILRTNK